MCAQRMLRSGPGGELIQSPSDLRPDQRQGALDLEGGATNAERMISRLAYENAQLIARLARAGLPTAIEEPPHPGPGHNSKPDPITELAASFAAQVVHLSSIQTVFPDDQDAAKVNASIEMIAEEADALVTAVINDAENHGLEASGPWLKIPLVEAQAFEVPSQNPEADAVDDEHERRLNT